MQYNSYEMKQHEFNDLMQLFLSVFEDDHYYAKMFPKAGQRKQQMEQHFSGTLQFCLQNGTVYGIREDDELIAFLIAFDYPYIAYEFPDEFMKMFGVGHEQRIQELPYYHELHERIEILGENVTYLLSVGVREDKRRKGIAGQLVDQLMRDHAIDYIVSDVSNDRTLPMYKAKGFKLIPLSEQYTFTKASPIISIQDLNLSKTCVALPQGFETIIKYLNFKNKSFKKILLHGYCSLTKFDIPFFKKESSATCEAYLFEVDFQELLYLQRYINVAQYHEDYLQDGENEFLLYSLIQEYEGPVLENEVLHTMLKNKAEEWNILYDMQIMIPMEYDDKNRFENADVAFDEDMRSFQRYMNFRMHYEAGVFHGDDVIDDRSGFKKRIKRYCLKKLRVKIMEEVTADSYDFHGNDIGQPAYVNIMVSIDEKGNAALISLISMSSPFLISHFMDNIIRNQLYVENDDKEWINLYQYLANQYALHKRGTPKLFVTVLQDRNRIPDEQLVSLLMGETIYNKEESLGCANDQDILNLLQKKNGMGQYDRAYVYAHTNVCIQFCKHLHTSIKGRFAEEAITYFYIELLGFEEAVIQIANNRISGFLTEEKTRTVSLYLDNIYEIYRDYAHTIEFWDIWMNYPSSRKSLRMLRDAFKIQEQLTNMDRNLLQLQRIFETQRDILDRKENSLLNYIILFLTLLQGIAVLFPMWFDGTELNSPYRVMGIFIIMILFLICVGRKLYLRRIHKRGKL